MAEGMVRQPCLAFELRDGMGDTYGSFAHVPLGSAVRQRKAFIEVVDHEEYARCRVQVHGQGVVRRDVVRGSYMRIKRQQVCHADDLLVAEIDAKVGGFGVVPPELEGAVVSSHYFLFEIDRSALDPAFLGFVLRTSSFQSQVNARGSTNYASIRPKHVLEYQIPLPPLPEQRAIAHVLRTVQRDLGATERVVAATQELKKSLMCHLFTYGPVPVEEADQVPLKETTIGPMPGHWQTMACKDVCKIISVGIVLKPASHYVPTGVPAFRSFNIREDHLIPTDLVYISHEANENKLSKSTLRTGDVLIVRTGNPGTACVVPPDYDGSNCVDLIFARPNHGVVTSEFLSRFLNSPSGKQQALASKTGLAQQHLNVAAVKRTLVPIPPLREQGEIVRILEAADRKMGAETIRLQALDSAVKTLLHDLMTGQRRLVPGNGP